MSQSTGAGRTLERGLRSLSIAADRQAVQQLLDYLELLQQWNSVFNLVADSDTGSMVVRHLLDSIAVQPFIAGTRIVDMGSGAGLPGIPLAILNPDKQFVLVDSNGKKTRFLFQAKTALGLGNIGVENCRIEHYQSPEQIDIVMCRAFSSLEAAVVSAAHLLGDNGRLLAMKGRFPKEEIERLPTEFTVTNVARLNIPNSETERHLLEVMRKPSDSSDLQQRL